VVADGGSPGNGSVPVLAATTPRRVLAIAAANFHAHQPKTMVAVTGTAGKTSVA
jgi:UDP-N-acetylmuramoyl-L-alanyl-D-glutamate--2,6-diaminopimelate ligase